MAELLHRLRTKYMRIEVYEDLVQLHGTYNTISLPPASILEMRLIPAKLLRDGRIECKVLWPEISQEPHPLTVALPPDKKKEQIAQRIVETVLRLKGQGVGSRPEPDYRHARDCNRKKPGGVAESAGRRQG